MSALDTRYPELDLFLHRLRRRLNGRWLVGEALKFAAFSAAAAVPMSFFVEGLLKVAAWAAVALAAGLTGAALRWHRRLTRLQAATWLDGAWRSRGVFAAAVEALDRPSEHFPDDLVLRQADRARREGGRPRLPWRRLALRFLLAAGMGAAALGLLVLPSPRIGPMVRHAEASAQAPGSRPTDPSAAPDRGDPALSPQEAARRLFPEDERLAALAEQALTSGDAGALESLLSQNPSAASSPELAGPRGPSLPRATPEPGGPGQGSGEPGAPAPGESGRQSVPASPAPGTPAPGQRGPSGPTDRPEGGDGSTPGRGSGGEGSLEFPRTGSGAPGTGHSEGKLGPVAPAPGNRRVVIAEKADPGVFEYVLPETGARVPLAQALSDSRRSAETALDRSSVPLEFENAVRSYFLSLSQEAKP